MGKLKKDELKMDETFLTHDKLVPYRILQTAIKYRETIFITGPASCGKTHLARRALGDDKEVLFAEVDCNVVTNATKLYTQILNSLRTKLKTRGAMELPKLMGLADFLAKYRELVAAAKRKRYKTVYVVLDRLDSLMKLDALNCMQAALDKDTLNLVLISIRDPRDIISSIRSIVMSTNLIDRATFIELGVASRADLVNLICMDMPTLEPELYRKFVNNVVNLMYQDRTRDYHDILRFCQENYEEFYRHYLDGFKQIVREKENITSDIDDEDLEDYDLESKKHFAIIRSFMASMKEKIRTKDLHTYNSFAEQNDRQVGLSKSILIIAAYVAAYTKPADDKRNFIRYQKRKVPKVADREAGNETRAKPFTLERFLQIYRSIWMSINGRPLGADETHNTSRIEATDTQTVDLSDSVLGDVHKMQQLHMIFLIGDDELCSQSRYKISSKLSRQYVDRLAEQINFSMRQIYGIPY